MRYLLLIFIPLVLVGINAHAQEIIHYPYEQSFELGLGQWVNDDGGRGNIIWAFEDDYDGSTNVNVLHYPSIAGNGDYYLLWDDRNENSSKSLTSPNFSLPDIDSAEVSFKFYLHGDKVHTAYVRLSMSLDDGPFNTIWEISQDRGGNWQSADIQLNDKIDLDDRRYLRVRFKFTLGCGNIYGSSNMQGQIAIDDFKVKNLDNDFVSTVPSPPEPVRNDPEIISINDTYGGIATANGNSATAAFDNSSSYYQENDDYTAIEFDMTGGCAQYNLSSYDITVDRDDHAPRHLTMYGGLDGGSWTQLDNQSIYNNWSNYQKRSFTLNTDGVYNKFKIHTSETEDMENLTRIREIDFFGHPAYKDLTVFELYANSASFKYTEGILAYENSESKGWLIRPLDGSQVILDFDEFDLTCDTDYLRIYNGSNIDASLFGEYTGSLLPPRLVSTGNAMYLEVITAAKNSESIGQGFKARYQSLLHAESNYPWTQVNDTSFVLDGRLGINTPFVSDEFDLLVNGGLVADELVIESLANAPDYVFEDDYDLKTLEEVRNYIEEHGHLPEVPSAVELEESGMSVSEMNLLLLKKIEELTLHLIESEQRFNHMNQRLKTLEQLNKN